MNWPMEAMSLNGAVLTWQRHPGRAVRLCLELPEHYTDPFSTMVRCTGSAPNSTSRTNMTMERGEFAASTL